LQSTLPKTVVIEKQIGVSDSNLNLDPDNLNQIYEKYLSLL
jgi:hypothetical protein